MIITFDEEALRVKCETVLPDETGALIEQLERELTEANRLGKNGIGLAAPQIGIAKHVAIIRMGHEFKLNLVNCKLSVGYDPIFFKEEGCLSFPGRVENTTRFQEVHITNNLVEPYSFVATGFLAIACQHELDHLNSTLFMDRAAPKPATIVKFFPVICGSALNLPPMRFPLKTKRHIVSAHAKVGPNDFCTCGSGKKYKKCCSR